MCVCLSVYTYIHMNKTFCVLQNQDFLKISIFSGIEIYMLYINFNIQIFNIYIYYFLYIKFYYNLTFNQEMLNS